MKKTKKTKQKKYKKNIPVADWLCPILPDAPTVDSAKSVNDPTFGACRSICPATRPRRLLREIDHIIDGDRFPLLPRIRILSAIRDKLRPPPPAREPLAPPKVYAPPRAGCRRR